ncbi:hypothetical protein LINPERHAP1_LOCUS14450 [Linum perenne]
MPCHRLMRRHHRTRHPRRRLTRRRSQVHRTHWPSRRARLIRH